MACLFLRSQCTKGRLVPPVVMSTQRKKSEHECGMRGRTCKKPFAGRKTTGQAGGKNIILARIDVFSHAGTRAAGSVAGLDGRVRAPQIVAARLHSPRLDQELAAGRRARSGLAPSTLPVVKALKREVVVGAPVATIVSSTDDQADDTFDTLDVQQPAVCA